MVNEIEKKETSLSKKLKGKNETTKFTKKGNFFMEKISNQNKYDNDGNFARKGDRVESRTKYRV